MLEVQETKGTVGQQYLEIIGPKLNSKTKTSIEAMLKPITSEEALNAVNAKTNQSLLRYAFYESTEHLIALCSFAQINGYQFNQHHIDDVFRSAMYCESSHDDRLLSLQFLTSFFEVPQIIYYEAGRNTDTQSLLTILSAAPPEKRAVALGESLCGVLEQPGKYSYQHIKLLFELGVNPHYTSYQRGHHNYMRSLCLWRATEDPKNQDVKRAELFSYLLKALNSKIINSDRPKYTQSLLTYYKTTLENQGDFLDDLFPDPAIPVVEKPPRDGNLLHWATNCGHVEIIDDVVDSFIEHDYGKALFIYNERDGYTPLGCAVFQIEKLTSELQGLAEDHEGRIELSEKLELYKKIANKLVVAGLRLGKEGFRFNRLKPRELSYILQWLDSETTSKDLNAQFKKYLQNIAEESSRNTVLEFLDPKLRSDTNFSAFQQEITTYFAQRERLGSGLLHWVVETNNSDLMPGILKVFCNHSITIHSTNAEENSALALAKQLDEREWMVGALESIPEIAVVHHVPSLFQMCMLKVRDKLINSDGTSELTVDQLEKLEEVKPNFRFAPFLDRRYYTNPNRTLLMSICANNEIDRLTTLKPLLTTADFGTADLKGNTVFHLVCQQQQIELLDILSATFHSWAKNKAGETPLHILCRKGFLEMIDLYLCIVGSEYSGDRMLTTKNNFGLIPLLCTSNEVRNALLSKEFFQSQHFLRAFQFVLAQELAEVLLSCIEEMKKEGTPVTDLPQESFIQALQKIREKKYQYWDSEKAHLSILTQFTIYLLSIGDDIVQNTFHYRLLERLRLNPTFRVGLDLDEKLTKDFDAFATSRTLFSELEIIIGAQPKEKAFDPEESKKVLDESTKQWQDSQKSEQPDNAQSKEIQAALAESLRLCKESAEKQTTSDPLARANQALDTLDKQGGLNSQQEKLLEDAKHQVGLAAKNPTNLDNLNKLTKTAQKCEAQQSAVWISLGLALLGLVTAIVGALILAVSAGTISTVFLAPLGAVSGKVATGMIAGGSVLFIAGLGLLSGSPDDDTTNDATHDQLKPSQVF